MTTPKTRQLRILQEFGSTATYRIQLPTCQPQCSPPTSRTYIPVRFPPIAFTHYPSVPPSHSPENHPPEGTHTHQQEFTHRPTPLGDHHREQHLVLPPHPPIPTSPHAGRPPHFPQQQTFQQGITSDDVPVAFSRTHIDEPCCFQAPKAGATYHALARPQAIQNI